MFEYYIGMQSFYKFHQISLLCDHQELACTPKDPPRRVDMNERSLISFCNQNHWVIDKNVRKPALLDLLARGHLRSYILIYLFFYLNTLPRMWTKTSPKFTPRSESADKKLLPPGASHPPGIILRCRVHIDIECVRSVYIVEFFRIEFASQVYNICIQFVSRWYRIWGP